MRFKYKIKSVNDIDETKGELSSCCTTTNEPKKGDTRVGNGKSWGDFMDSDPVYNPPKRFLYFPKFINGEWRWLEKAKWMEEYRANGYKFHLGIDGHYHTQILYGWVPYKWASQWEDK